MKVPKSKLRPKKKGRMSLEEIREGLPLKPDGGEFQFDIAGLGRVPEDDPLQLFNNTDIPAQQALLQGLPQDGTGLAQMPYSREANGQGALDYDAAAERLMRKYPRGNFNNRANFQTNQQPFDFRNVPEYANAAFQGIANMFGPKPSQDTSGLNVLSYGQTHQGDMKVFGDGGNVELDNKVQVLKGNIASTKDAWNNYQYRLDNPIYEDSELAKEYWNGAKFAYFSEQNKANDAFKEISATWNQKLKTLPRSLQNLIGTLPENPNINKLYRHGGLHRFPGGGDIKDAPIIRNVLPDGFDSAGNPVSYKKPSVLETPLDVMNQQHQFLKKEITDPLNYFDVEFERKNTALREKLAANDATPTNPNSTIRLKNGRFRGANVQTPIIDRAIDTSVKTNVPLGQMLSVIGRESTFGEDPSVKGTGSGLKELVSGWDIAEPYKPKRIFQFLHENNVPGLTAKPNKQRIEFESEDPDATREYVNKHPELLEKYKQQLSQTRDLGNLSSFDLAAAKLKQGVRQYNPNDPNYEAMFNKDYNLLANEPELQLYLRSKGAKFKMGGKYRKKC